MRNRLGRKTVVLLIKLGVAPWARYNADVIEQDATSP